MMQLHCNGTCTQLWPDMKSWGGIVLNCIVETRIHQSLTTDMLKQGMKFLTTLMRTTNSCKIGSVAKLKGHLWPSSFCRGGPQSASLWRLYLSKDVESFGSNCFLNICILHAIFNHYDNDNYVLELSSACYTQLSFFATTEARQQCLYFAHRESIMLPSCKCCFARHWPGQLHAAAYYRVSAVTEFGIGQTES